VQRQKFPKFFKCINQIEYNDMVRARMNQ
jgi:hypothetical protein